MSSVAAPEEAASRAAGLLADYRRRSAGQVQLYAGTNVLSPLAESLMAPDVGMMPAIGAPGAKQQPGTDEISDLERLVEAEALALFGGEWAEVRLQSGTYANAAVYLALTAPGDLIAVIGANNGGHTSHHASGSAGALGRQVVELPFDPARSIVDDAAAALLVRHRNPRLVMLGASLILAPYETEMLVAACRDTGALLVYDASHVAGLVAGGCFQNPFELGCDVVTTSTYKSLGGPPGGLVIGRDRTYEAALRRIVVGPLTSNYDASRLPALAVSLAEARAFMPDYASAMLANARSLAAALMACGIELLPPHPPRTHQVAIRCGSRAEAEILLRRAEAAGLIFGMAAVAGSPGLGALRLGTQAVTRLGADADHMKAIARELAAILGGDDPAKRRAEVAAIADRLGPPRYCFEPLPNSRATGGRRHAPRAETH